MRCWKLREQQIIQPLSEEFLFLDLKSVTFVNKSWAPLFQFAFLYTITMQIWNKKSTCLLIQAVNAKITLLPDAGYLLISGENEVEVFFKPLTFSPEL